MTWHIRGSVMELRGIVFQRHSVPEASCSGRHCGHPMVGRLNWMSPP